MRAGVGSPPELPKVGAVVGQTADAPAVRRAAVQVEGETLDSLGPAAAPPRDLVGIRDGLQVEDLHKVSGLAQDGRMKAAPG